MYTYVVNNGSLKIKSSKELKIILHWFSEVNDHLSGCHCFELSVDVTLKWPHPCSVTYEVGSLGQLVNCSRSQCLCQMGTVTGPVSEGWQADETTYQMHHSWRSHWRSGIQKEFFKGIILGVII